MTTEAMDLLNLLSQQIDPNAAKERSIQREFGRSPLQNFTATIFVDPQQPTIQVEQGKSGGTQWNETHLAVQLKDVEVTKHDSYGWYEDTDYQITMKVADSGFENREDDEVVLWMAGLQNLIPGANLANLNGTRIQFEEKHKQYTFKRKKNNYVPEEGTRWWYEAVKVVGSAKNNGTKTVEPKPASLAQALDLLISAGEDGIVEAEFNMQVSKLVKGDAPFLGYLADGKFATDQIAAGKVLRDGLKLVAV